MLTPEQAQRITDLRTRMYQNVASGLPAQHGISADEIREGLSFLRQNRAGAVAKSTAAKKKAKAASAPGAPVNLDAFGDLD